MSKILVSILIMGLVAAGIYAFRSDGLELGQGVSDNAQIVSIADITSNSDKWNGQDVVVQGEIIQKCPTTGCWFYLKDSTGEIRVSTSLAGFTATSIPIHKIITVQGRVVALDGDTVELAASGVK